MKSESWISGPGRSPYSAMPMAAPTIPPSASGVSITRSGPNSSYRPAVARNTPPNLPTSSPSTTTRGSRRISSRRASLTAWMMFHWAIRASPGRRPALDPALHEELAGLVRRPHQRAGGDELEAECHAFALEIREHLGPHVLLDGQVLLGGAQVLAQGEDVAAGGAQIAHRLQHLAAQLAQAQHEGRLGAHPAALVVLEHRERLAIGGAPVAHARREALDRLEVVRSHGGPRLEDHVERLAAALEVRREHLDQRARRRP